MLTVAATTETPFLPTMSFLATEEDTSILNDAIAFLEACDSKETLSADADSTDSSSLDDVPSLDDLLQDSNLELLDVPRDVTSCTSPTATKDQSPKPKATKKRRVRSAETSSTGLQRRKRAELANLRDQVEELQGVLCQLKNAECSSPSLRALEETAVELGVKSYRSQAIEQYRLRLQAEKVNRHLKAIMKNQTKVRESFYGVLQKRSTLYGMDYVFKNQEPSCGPLLSGASYVDAWIDQLEKTAERLSLLSRSIFEEKPPTAISTSMQCKYDERRKTKIVEFETFTPLCCSFQDASRLLWSDFQSDRKMGTKPDTLIKKIVLTMPSRQGAISAEKLHFLRKYQDSDQTLLTWADIMVLPTKKELRFRTEGMILLAPSDEDSQASISRSLLKLYLDVHDTDCDLRPEDIAYAQDIVLGAMAMKIRLYWQSFQNMMIEGATNSQSQNIVMANDRFATLNDAVAFLGWCENEVGRNDNVLLENIDDMLDGAVKSAAVMSSWKQQWSGMTSSSPPKKKPRFRNSACSSTALQRKKKAEIQTLREQAVELKGYLKQLKKRRQGSSTDFLLGVGGQSDDGLSSWHQRSIIEYQDRLRSEQTNKRLIEILDHQKKICSKLQNLFKRQNGQTFGEKIELPSREISIASPNFLLSQLENQVGHLYWESNASFRPQEPFQLHCASQVNYDKKLKSPIVEYTTTTPVDCSSEDTCEGIWGFIREHMNAGYKPNSLQTRVSLPLQHKQCILHFEWFYYVEKIVLDDQIVIVWSDAVLLPSHKLKYRTHGYTVITPTESGCGVRTKVKLYRERNGEDLVEESTSMKQAHDIAFGALSIKMRRFWQAEQRRLVQQSLR
ncbi:hypothetical protein P3T76_014928 [Phytophthora citrophthora]|uniref:M96 mating-specific protein family n=1 Tax=Phytophthora citrophthora TaxID=4793 RepID=A0AAD9G0N9_9STRA|nr:hypothetical protein P3T76_014928 [Phytophthora citrophthora]